MTLQLNAPLPEGMRQRLAGHGKRMSPRWWLRRLRALESEDGRRWWWRAGDDEPDAPMQ